MSYRQKVERTGNDRAGQLTDGESRRHQTEKRRGVVGRPRPGLLSDRGVGGDVAAAHVLAQRRRDQCLELLHR